MRDGGQGRVEEDTHSLSHTPRQDTLKSRITALSADTDPFGIVNFIAKEWVDGSSQGGDANLGSVLCWHPRLNVLAVATNAAVVEYDAVSGCRRAMVDCDGSPVKLMYTPDGQYLILLTRERNVFAWSTATWKKEVLLVAEAKYAQRPLVSGMLAVSARRDAGDHRVVFYSPMGKKTIRTIHMGTGGASSNVGKEKEVFRPGYKLKTDNKKVLVGLAADVIDPYKVYVLTVDGEVMACHVGLADGTLTPVSGVHGVPFNATQERVKLHAVPHVNPRKRGTASLIVVEAERSGITVLESDPTGIDVIDTLRIGTGGMVSGFGLVERGSIAVAAVSQARGNIGFYAWRFLACPEKSVRFQPCNVVPGSLWAALDASERGSSESCLAMDESGHSMVSGAVIHPKSGLMAFWPSANASFESASANSAAARSGASGLRIPVVETVNVSVSGGLGMSGLGGMGAPCGQPLHSSPYFWIQGSDAAHDGVVSQLFFPRYAHLNSKDAVMALDVCHGAMSTAIRPNLSVDKTHRTLSRAVHSSKKSTWLLFAEVSSGEHAGCYHFSATSDSDAMVSPGSWWVPGRDGAFVGSRDELVVVLSNSGTRLAVFDTLKLAGGRDAAASVGMIGTMSAPEGSVVTRIFRGPVARIPGPPKPKPDVDSDDSEIEEEDEDALREWEAYEAKRKEVPRTILALTARNKLCVLAASHGYSSMNSNAPTKAAVPKASYQLPQSAAVVQFAWQSLVDPAGEFHSDMPGAADAAACLLAVALSDRVVFLNDRLEHISTCLLPEDVGSAVSCLWVGPSLLVSTSNNQVMYVSIDGTSHHGCSTMMGPPVTLLAATGDAIMYVYASGGNAGAAIESASRAWDPVPMMMLGWAQLAEKSILPGGTPRARKSLLSLISSYGSTKIPTGVLEALATHGFSDLSAAAATCSELPTMSDARKNMFQAAARDWDPAVSALLTEYEESEYYPDHPEEHSALFQKMVMLARSAELHGKFKHARTLFEAAGAWRELLALCLFQGDFDALQRYGSRGGRRAELIASHLLAVNEDAFRRSVATNNPRYGGRPFVEDYDVLGQDKGREMERERERYGRPATPDAADDIHDPADGGITNTNTNTNVPVEPAPSDRLPFMQATLQLDEESIAAGRVAVKQAKVDGGGNGNDSDDSDQGDADPIPRVDRTKLAPYLGIAGAAVRPGCIIADDVMGAGGLHDGRDGEGGGGVGDGEHELDDIDFDDFADDDDSDLGAVQRVIIATAASPGSVSDTATETSRADSHLSASTAATRDVSARKQREQEEARAAFMASKKLIDDEFYSSDDDSSVMGGGVGGGLGGSGGRPSASSFAAMTSSKLIFRIKSKEEKEAEARSGTADETTRTSLSAAVQNLTLGGGAPGRGNVEAAEAAKAAQSKQTPTGTGSAPIPEELFSEPPASTRQQAMRPPEPDVPQSDLLSGWDAFEAMFSDDGNAGSVAATGVAAPTTAATTAATTGATTGHTAPSLIDDAVPVENDSVVAPSITTTPLSSFSVPAAARGNYIDGMAYFNVSGSAAPAWNKASKQLAKAFAASSAKDENFRRRCANEYAAASLMQSASKSRKPVVAAKLARYAAALDTDTNMQLVTQLAAAELNIKAGNRRWASELLETMLIELRGASVSASGSEIDGERVRRLLVACGGAGAEDKSIPRDEDVQTTRMIIEAVSASSGGLSEVNEILAELQA